MLTWQCGSHPALSQCSIELLHPVFVTSLHRSVDEATLVGVFFPAAGKDVSNLSSRAKSSAWCCRPRQHSVFFSGRSPPFWVLHLFLCRHEEGTCVFSTRVTGLNAALSCDSRLDSLYACVCIGLLQASYFKH